MFKNGWKKKITGYVLRKKKFFALIAVILIAAAYFNFSSKKTVGQTNGARTLTVNVEKSFEFPALDNTGKEVKDKIKMKIKNVEKTDQVLVKDQVFTAKNNKLFLIANIDLTNDATQSLNLMPGDLIRLSVENDNETRYAPDLHNNLVPVAAISTRIDRVGFVIPENAKNFVIYIGEIDGDKQEISLNFPS